MICPRCQQFLNDDAQFCSACGLSTAEIKAEKTQILEQRDTLRLPVDPLIGQTLDSKYQLVARLGEGGMGIVYCAHRLHIGDEVALKVLHQQFVRDAKAVERFRREARSAAMIRHPNVVVIHDFNEAEAEGAPAYIVMELVRGKSLRELLKQEGKLPAARAVALMEQICAGVGAAHRQGIVHRDLKPDNVIIVPGDDGTGETVKVLDFGLAKLRDVSAESSLTESGAMLGTPSYLPPEQCRGEPLDARSDVYSLGAMLYEMLSGARPFVAPSVAGLIAKHLYEPPPPFPTNIVIPPALEAVVRRALSKNPQERQADASAFIRELQTAVGPSPSAGRASWSTVEATRTISPPRKSQWLPWTVAAIFAVLMFAVVAALAINYVRGRVGNNANTSKASDAHATGGNSSETTGTNKDSENTSSNTQGQYMLGTWTGTYGVLNSPATLIVKDQKGSKWSGVLEQGEVRVAFSGNIDESTHKVTFKETEVLRGSGWSLGENMGELSADRRKMSGTGKDATGAQLGISYDWAFSRQ